MGRCFFSASVFTQDSFFFSNPFQFVYYMLQHRLLWIFCVECCLRLHDLGWFLWVKSNMALLLWIFLLFSALFPISSTFSICSYTFWTGSSQSSKTLGYKRFSVVSYLLPSLGRLYLYTLKLTGSLLGHRWWVDEPIRSIYFLTSAVVFFSWVFPFGCFTESPTL